MLHLFKSKARSLVVVIAVFAAFAQTGNRGAAESLRGSAPQSEGARASKVDQERFVIDTAPDGKPSRYLMQGMRYRNPGKPPVVLAHGFLNTYEMMEVWGRYLYDQGFDVWMFNHLGFGLEGERSVVKDYRRGDYGFDSLLKGIDQVVHHVNRETGQKVNYFSFSMGGMTYQQYISGMVGVDEKTGNALRDPKVARARQALIRSSVTVGAPPYRLDGIGFLPKGAAALGHAALEAAFKDVDSYVLLGLGGPADNLGNSSVVGKSLDLIPTPVGKWYRSVLLRDIGNLEHFGPRKNDLAYVLSRMFSNPHTDILRSFGKMANSATEDAPMKSGKVPDLAIFGTKDKLANAEELFDDFVERTRDQYLNPKMKRLNQSAIVMSDFGHLDLMLEDAIHEHSAGQRVVDYLKSPARYQAKYGRFQVLGPDHSRARKIAQRYEREVKPIEEDFRKCSIRFGGIVGR